MSSTKLRLGAGGGAALLLAVALFLPSAAILDFLSARVHTVASFRGYYERGFLILRGALLLGSLLCGALPFLLSRCGFGTVSGEEGRGRPREWGAALILYAVPFLLALPNLGFSFQNDEWRTLNDYVRHGPGVILTRTFGGENHALYSLLSWPFVALFGIREWTPRIPGLLLAPLAPVLLFAILRRKQPKGPAFFASLLLAMTPHLVRYAHEGRSYGIVMTLVLALVWLRPRMLSSSSSVPLVAYVLLGGAAVEAHIFSVAAVLGLGMAGLLQEARGSSRWWRNLASLITTGILSLLGYSFLLPGYFEYSEWTRREPMPDEPLGLLLSNGFTPEVLVGAIPFWVLLLLGAWRERKEALLPALLALGVIVAVAEVSQAQHITRMYTPALALLWVLIGSGVAGERPRRVRDLACVMGLVGLCFSQGIYQWEGRPDYRRLATELQDRVEVGESVALLYNVRPVCAYWKRKIPVVDEEGLEGLRPDWLALSDADLPGVPGLGEWLEREYDQEIRIRFSGGALIGFRRKQP